MAHVGATGQKYKYAMRLRPDLMFVAPFPHPETLDLGDAQHPTVRFGSKSESCCGNEDMLGVGLFDIVMGYLSRFGELVAEENHPGVRFRKDWISEEFLEIVLREVHGATLQEEESIRVVHPKSFRTNQDKGKFFPIKN